MRFYCKEGVSEGHAFSRHSLSVVYPNVFDNQCPGVHDPGMVIFRISNSSHCLAKSVGLHRLIVGLAPRLVSPTIRLWHPIKWSWGNRLLVFRPATFRLGSLSGVLDARRQLCTRVPCLSPLFLTSIYPALTFGPASPRQCGGAQQRARPTTLKRRRRRADRTSKAGPSNHTGAQTAKKRKAGSRVAKDFGGDGKALNDGTPGGSGAGFRKRAQRYRPRM